MRSFADRLAVQSYSFRKCEDSSKIIELILKCGFSRVELCGLHIDFSTPAAFWNVINAYRQSHLNVFSVGVELFKNDRAFDLSRFTLLRQAGIKMMSVDFKQETFQETVTSVTALADQYDVNIALHNHGKEHWLGNSKMLDHVLKTTNARLGLCLDTGWAIDAHEDPVAMLREFDGRVFSTHIKDFFYSPPGTGREIVVGQARLNLAAFLAALHELHYEGEIIVEDEGGDANPASLLREFVRAMKSTE
jgi:inosose dehydratase